jgi:hypothetical protein
MGNTLAAVVFQSSSPIFIMGMTCIPMASEAAKKACAMFNVPGSLEERKE